MKSFKDTSGISWTISINVPAANRDRVLGGADPLSIAEVKDGRANTVVGAVKQERRGDEGGEGLETGSVV